MSSQERIRIVLDAIGTVALVITAGVLVWATTSRMAGEAAGAVAAPAPGLFDSVEMTLSAAGPVKGSKQAKVAIVGFSDFQCPYCERFARETLPQLKREFIDRGTVQFIHRNNPLEGIHPLALMASVAAECAGEQRKFWEMHDMIFSHQRELSEASFAGYAKDLRLDAKSFATCVESEPARIKEDQAEAARLGVQSTPIFLIGRVEPNGTIKVTKRINGAASYQAFKAALEAVL